MLLCVALRAYLLDFRPPHPWSLGGLGKGQLALSRGGFVDCCSYSLVCFRLIGLQAGSEIVDRNDCFLVLVVDDRGSFTDLVNSHTPSP